MIFGQECAIYLFLKFFYCFRRRQRITPRIALPPPTRTAYSRSTSFQSGVYSRSSSFDQKTSGTQQRSSSFKQQQPAVPRRPDTYASESSLEDRLVCILLHQFLNITFLIYTATLNVLKLPVSSRATKKKAY
jgi:hypothetical protein